MNSKEIIRVENVSYRYKKNQKYVINEADFTVLRGFVYGVAGKNSMGKSTLLKILCGDITSYNGNIIMEGAENTVEYKSAIGVIMDSEKFFPHLSLIDNVLILTSLYEKFNMELFREYLKKYNIDEDEKLSGLSEGEKIKFRIGFALSYEPEVLIMDEPTGVLDVEAREDFINLVRLLATEKNITVIMAAHLTADLDRMADYILFVNDNGTTELYDRETLNDKYRLLKGSRESIKRLPPKAVMAVEESNTSVAAMTDRYEEIKVEISDKEIIAEIPDIEKIMYFRDKALKGKEPESPKNNGNKNQAKRETGSNYRGLKETYRLMYLISGKRWLLTGVGVILYMYWCAVINSNEGLVEGIWYGVLIALSYLILESNREAPKHISYEELQGMLNYLPVTRGDRIKYSLVKKAEALTACIIICIVISWMFKNITIAVNVISATMAVCAGDIIMSVRTIKFK